jgi:hypothetical protein
MNAVIRTTRLLLVVLPGVLPALAVDVEVTHLDGHSVRGRVVAITSRVVLETPQGKAEVVWPDVLSVRRLEPRKPASAPAAAEGPLRLELVDGSLFSGRITTASAEELVVRLRGGQTSRLATNAVRAIVSTSASEAARREITVARRSSEDPQDVAIVARGKDVAVLRGAVKRIDPQRVLFMWSGREMALPWERVGGLVFARPTPRGASCVITLLDGDVFAGRVAGGDAESLTLQSGVFDELVLPWTRVERIDCRSERLVFLSDLEPRHYEFHPFFDKHWDFARDKTLTGKPIRLGGRGYDKGITMHSRSGLAYRLDGAFRQFAAEVGIVDEMDERGCVALRVIGDGDVLWEAAGVRGGEPPRQVLVDIGGIDELVLIVDYDQDLDLSDHACWAFARLIR